MISEELQATLADRSPAEEIQRQKELLLAQPHIAQMLEAFPESAAVVNKHRQMVLCNTAMRNALPGGEGKTIEGTRLGEHMQCVNALHSIDGCGTTEQCNTCGAMIAILAAQDGRSDVEECRLTMQHGGIITAMDFRVYTSPLDVEGEQFSVVSLVDISDEKRRRILERIFFHDVNNTAGGIYGLAKLLPFLTDMPDKEELVQRIESASRQLLDEIESQRDLLAAENDELRVVMQDVPVSNIMERIYSMYSHHARAQGLSLECLDGGNGEIIETDPTQLVRCLGNLTKNAMEALLDGGTVTLSYERRPGGVRFSVHNPGAIPREAELQIFQRSFSTKGDGRGIGTYSVKLLVERYLGGEAGFRSSEAEGTTFFIDLPQPPRSATVLP